MQDQDLAVKKKTEIKDQSKEYTRPKKRLIRVSREVSCISKVKKYNKIERKDIQKNQSTW